MVYVKMILRFDLRLKCFFLQWNTRCAAHSTIFDEASVWLAMNLFAMQYILTRNWWLWLANSLGQQLEVDLGTSSMWNGINWLAVRFDTRQLRVHDELFYSVQRMHD